MSRLPDPRTAAGRAGLAAVLADPTRALVAVDFDGTLAPIVARPEDARPAPGAVDALRKLAGRMGAVVIVTARPAAEAVRLAGLGAGDRIEVLGHYGLQRWVSGGLDSPPPDPAVAAARRRMPDLLAGAPPGVHVEDKRHSLVVHTRPAADPARTLADLAPRLQALAAELGLEAVPGRFVIELRPPGIDKGYAVRRLAAAHDVRAVVYIGDDLGDLSAYDAVEAQRQDGIAGLTVASAGDDAPPEPAARADLVLDGPLAVVAFLRAIADAIAPPYPPTHKRDG